MRTAKTLIRLGGCPGWSESSLGAHSILLVLSCRGSYVLPWLIFYLYHYLHCSFYYFQHDSTGEKQEIKEYKRVAIVDDFFDIIYGVHVEMDGRGGKHAGQKRTYRAVSLCSFGRDWIFFDQSFFQQYENIGKDFFLLAIKFFCQSLKLFEKNLKVYAKFVPELNMSRTIETRSWMVWGCLLRNDGRPQGLVDKMILPAALYPTLSRTNNVLKRTGYHALFGSYLKIQQTLALIIIQPLQTKFEASHEIVALFVLRKLILQTHMRSHPVGLYVWCMVGPFVCFHTSCVRTAKALARLCECAGSPEASLVAYVISTITSWAGSDFVQLYLCNFIKAQLLVGEGSLKFAIV